HPLAPSIYTLSLHDALPISCNGSSTVSMLRLARLSWTSTAHLNPRTTLGNAIIKPSPWDFTTWPPCVSMCPRTMATYSRRSSFRSEEHTSELQSRENLVCRL